MVAMFHHVGLEVRQLERSIRFYTDFFGFRVEKRLRLGEEEIAFLRRDAFVLELVENGETEGAGSVYHLAFGVECLEETREMLLAAGIPEAEGIRQWENGWKNAFFLGPNGEWIELLETG
jgi:catechol 2,3-dioxygenase-like lactoylglutathione lyase family enzyme